MRVALATWQDRISPVFDVARQVLLVELAQGKIVNRRLTDLTGQSPREQVEQLTAMGVQVLICGAVSRPLAMMLAAASIQVIPFTAGEVESVLTAWLAGRLPGPEWVMPGCRCRRGRQGRRAKCVNRQAVNRRTRRQNENCNHIFR
ncbi:MAG: NifB/NifX family molybdenum-iron cluster-binding protein [Kiritimatiellia bacterium]|nr:dinitrogenase iron-molybdenum cofactor biosynthesis protein [Lentisphaerota bacterium]